MAHYPSQNDAQGGCRSLRDLRASRGKQRRAADLAPFVKEDLRVLSLIPLRCAGFERLFFLLLGVKISLGFLLDGRAVHAFDKYVGINEPPGANHHDYPAYATPNPARAWQYHVLIRRFFHCDLICQWLRCLPRSCAGMNSAPTYLRQTYAVSCA